MYRQLFYWRYTTPPFGTNFRMRACVKAVPPQPTHLLGKVHAVEEEEVPQRLHSVHFHDLPTELRADERPKQRSQSPDELRRVDKVEALEVFPETLIQRSVRGHQLGERRSFVGVAIGIVEVHQSVVRVNEQVQARFHLVYHVRPLDCMAVWQATSVQGNDWTAFAIHVSSVEKVQGAVRVWTSLRGHPTLLGRSTKLVTDTLRSTVRSWRPNMSKPRACSFVRAHASHTYKSTRRGTQNL